MIFEKSVDKKMDSIGICCSRKTATIRSFLLCAELAGRVDSHRSSRHPAVKRGGFGVSCNGVSYMWYSALIFSQHRCKLVGVVHDSFVFLKLPHTSYSSSGCFLALLWLTKNCAWRL